MGFPETSEREFWGLRACPRPTNNMAILLNIGEPPKTHSPNIFLDKIPKQVYNQIMKETCVGLAKVADVPFLVFFDPF